MTRLALLASLSIAMAYSQPSPTFVTYLGGNEFDTANALAVDAAGFVYLAGQTFSQNFPIQAAAQPGCALGPRRSCTDGFVAKIDPFNARIIWSTYLGRDFGDAARAIAVGPDGSVAITGNISQTAFVARLNPDGGLIYLQQFGRFAVNVGHAVALDDEGNAYVAGQTMDPNFPATSGAWQRYPGPASCTPIGGGSLLLDAFVMKLSPSGSLLYSTFLGGSGNDRALGIAVDPLGNAWVAGTTGSSDFPMSGSLQTTYAGGAPEREGACEGGDAFVAKLNTDGSALKFSTYLGGPDLDIARALALDAYGNVYVTGQSGSEGFTAKLDPAIPRLVYSVAGGGSGIALDSGGNAYVGERTAAVLRIDPDGVPSQYYSPAFTGLLSSLAIDHEGSLYLTGDAREGLPIEKAIQDRNAGNSDAFVIKLKEERPKEGVEVEAPLRYSTNLNARHNSGRR